MCTKFVVFIYHAIPNKDHMALSEPTQQEVNHFDSNATVKQSNKILRRLAGLETHKSPQVQ